MSADRDAAEVMTADYYAVEHPPGTGVLVAVDEPRNEGEAYAQPLAAEHRYGVLTTRFSLAMRIMFADMPRTLASHWYKKLLGLDIARSEGLFSVDELDGELPWPAPLDVDDKGVWQEGCASYHATLDGLSYPWARYNGIDLEGGTTAVHLEDRAGDVIPSTDGWIFGRPVDGPEQWVAEAIASDAFARQTVGTFWRQIFQQDPYTCEALFEELWTGSGPRTQCRGHPLLAGHHRRLRDAMSRSPQSPPSCSAAAASPSSRTRGRRPRWTRPRRRGPHGQLRGGGPGRPARQAVAAALPRPAGRPRAARGPGLQGGRQLRLRGAPHGAAWRRQR